LRFFPPWRRRYRPQQPLTVFVFNDNAVGQERHDLIHKGLPPKYAEVASPDFEKLAVGFGAKGLNDQRPNYRNAQSRAEVQLIFGGSLRCSPRV
jgi:thiamine pyrophosphate-dependent acetolactate synthase large subunit-like protein